VSNELRVLLVEDEPADAELVLRSLERDGLSARARRVSERDDVRDALDCEPWDVILCDHHSLPGFKSTDVLKLAMALAPNTPLIVVSGMVQTPDVPDLIRNGAAGYVDKAQLAHLAPTIRRVLEQVAHARSRYM
jgi:DNA-binding NtrC family response regulator